MSKLSNWLNPRLRLWAIYRKLGFVPWRKPRTVKQGKDGIFKGTGEAIIPFLNDDSYDIMRSFIHECCIIINAVDIYVRIL